MRRLSREELHSFIRDGFVVLKDIVPRSMVNSARRAFFKSVGRTLGQHQRGMQSTRKDPQKENTKERLQENAVQTPAMANIGLHTDICNLVADGSDIRALIEHAVGDAVHGLQFAQVAARFPTEPSESVTESGYRDRDIPFFGWHGHLDGLWNGSTSPHQNLDRSMTNEEWNLWSQKKGRNGVLRTYPGTGTNLTNFTALLGIPLSDQSREGVGNLGLLRSAHEPVSRFFRYQRAQGGPLGPDGPGWERLDREAPNGSGLRHYPEQVRDQFRQEAKFTSDGRMWPKPSLIRMELGDAVLALHAVPHSASRCEGSEPRVMAYYRITSRSRPEKARFNYIDGLCDCWQEWKGIQDTVREIQATSS